MNRAFLGTIVRGADGLYASCLLSAHFAGCNGVQCAADEVGVPQKARWAKIKGRKLVSAEQAHYDCCSPQKNRSRSKGALGEITGQPAVIGKVQFSGAFRQNA